MTDKESNSVCRKGNRQKYIYIKNGNIFLFKVKESDFVLNETDWKETAWDKF